MSNMLAFLDLLKWNKQALPHLGPVEYSWSQRLDVPLRYVSREDLGERALRDDPPYVAVHVMYEEWGSGKNYSISGIKRRDGRYWGRAHILEWILPRRLGLEVLTSELISTEDPLVAALIEHYTKLDKN